jgi:hypothetical protein
VAHHVQHAAALDPGADRIVDEMHRHRDADGLAGGQALEIDMLGPVAHRMELHVADQRAGRGTVHGDLIEPRAPAAAMDFAQHGARIEGDQARRLMAAIDHAGHLAGPTGRPRSTFAGPLARLGGDGDETGHIWLLNGPARRRPTKHTKPAASTAGERRV